MAVVWFPRAYVWVRGVGQRLAGKPGPQDLGKPKFCQIETLLGEQLTREGNAASARTTQGTDECDF